MEEIDCFSNNYSQELINCIIEAVAATSKLPTDTPFTILTSDSKICKHSQRVCKKISDKVAQFLNCIIASKRYNHVKFNYSNIDLFDNYNDISDIVDIFLSTWDTYSLSNNSNDKKNTPKSKINQIEQSKNNDETFQEIENDQRTISGNYTQSTNDKLIRTTSYGDFTWNLENKSKMSTACELITPNADHISQINYNDISDWHKATKHQHDHDFTSHPYKKEILELNWKNLKRPEGKLNLFQMKSIQKPKNIDHVKPIWITTDEELERLMHYIIDNCSEIAIDLEHHSKFSYKGITCLIQLSTRENDYLLDPFEITNMQLLNVVTTNPKILKVLHGSASDVVWLHSDFGVYIVNLFDTSNAASYLKIPGGCGLANLLKLYCNVISDKKFQMADWRARPLNNMMIKYAQMDTHYLLYIHDKLSSELLRIPGALNIVLQRCKMLCLNCEIRNGKNFKDKALILLKNHIDSIKNADEVNFDQAIVILEKLLEWREALAQLKDCSPPVILRNDLLVSIALEAPSNYDFLLKTMKQPFQVAKYSTSILKIVNDTINLKDLNKTKVFHKMTPSKIDNTSNNEMENCQNFQKIYVPSQCNTNSTKNSTVVSSICKSTVMPNDSICADAFQVVFCDYANKITTFERAVGRVVYNEFVRMQKSSSQPITSSKHRKIVSKTIDHSKLVNSKNTAMHTFDKLLEKKTKLGIKRKKNWPKLKNWMSNSQNLLG